MKGTSVKMTDIRNRYLALKRALFDKYYSNLNEKQRDAVFTVKDPLLILAGAGSGKTTVLVKRIEFIIKYGNAYYSEAVPVDVDEARIAELERALMLPKEELEPVLSEFICRPCPPWKVLAITFTNKAANEIKARLASAIGEDELDGEVVSGTFHSVCVRILRRYGELIGYKSGFSIYDTDDQKKLVASCMKILNIDEKNFPIRAVMNEISRAKDKLITPEEYANSAGSDYKLKKIAEIYKLYQSSLLSANAVDFDDIIMQTVFLLEDHADVREYYQNRFEYVCVDEYQDTNVAQFRLTVLLSGRYNNIMVVGDDDQSIYKFRGATIENILDFDRNFKSAKVIKLEQNYRSTQNILSAANAVIKNNLGRRGKELWCDSGAGEKISVNKLDNQNEEAKYIIGKIQELVIKEKKSYRDFAVLYRVNAQSNTIEKAFAKSGIPYRVFGGVRFTDRKEIRDVIAYLCLINNPSDNIRLKRIINEPKRKIGDATVSAVEQIAIEENCSMFEIMKRANEYTILSRQAAKLQDFVRLIENLGYFEGSVSEMAEKMLNITGYRQMLIDNGEVDAERVENVDEFISNIIEYERDNPDATLAGFLEETALVAEVDKYDENADAAVLMTIHSAKGLEFPVVFLPGLEEGIFPGMQSMMDPEELEEERRLAYVAITRAKQRLYMTHVRERLIYGKTAYNPPTRFLAEIPDDLKESDMPPERSAPRRIENTSFSASPRRVSSEFTKKTTSAPKAQTLETFEVGDIVRHMTFGRGEILSVRPMGADTMYEIVFDNVGTKKLMATYAKLKKM